jgi:ABC-type transport system involved in multi-copper enzyme maturation permease subunit
MIRTILYREIYDGITSFTFSSALALLTVLVPLSAYIQAQYYRQVIADYSVRQNIHEAENSAHAAIITRPVPPLLPLFNGVYDSLPDEITVRNDSAPRTLSSEDLRPLDWLFPKIDLGIIVGVLMTLMAVLLGHDTIAGEREQGTLKLVLSSPVSKNTVLVAKLMGVVGLMSIGLIYTVMLYVLVLTASSGGAFALSAPRLLEITILMLIAILTVVVFASLSVIISTMVKRSSVALALSIAIWVATVLIWPTLGPYIAATFWPVPPRQAVQHEMLNKEAELIRQEVSDHKRAAAELKAGNTDVEVAWQRFLEIKRLWIERKKTEIGDLTANRERQIGNQQMRARIILSLSPYGAFTESLGTLCGTGLEGQNLFLDSAEQYEREQFISASFEFLAKEKPWMSSSGTAPRFEIPPFQMPMPSRSERLQGLILPVVFLLLEIGIVLGIRFLKFARYDAG